MNLALRNVKNLNRYLKYFRIVSHKPVVVMRILMNYFNIIFLRRKVVRKAEFGVTFDCQCDCGKCSSERMKNPKGNKLTLEEIKQTAEEIISLGAIQVNFTGGEPLLEKDLVRIIKYFKPYKTIITINTNGVLLNEKKIDELEKARVDIIKISIDSPLPQEHDKSRGYKGCFESAVSALRYLKKKKNILGQISTVCVKENLNSFRIWKLIAMAKEYNALLGLTIPTVSGRWSGNENILIGDREKDILGEIIKFPQVIRDTDEGYLRSNCPASSEEFYLTCYGDIIPCPLIQIAFGNVRQETVKAIWKKMCDFKEYKLRDNPGCLAGENRKFIEKYLLPIKDRQQLPVGIEEYSEE